MPPASAGPQPSGDVGDAGDVVRVVGQAGHEDEPDADAVSPGGETVAEREGRLKADAGHLPVRLRVAGLDVEQDQVGVVEQPVARPDAEEPGGVQGGVHTLLLAAVQVRLDEGALQQRLAAGDGHAAAGRLDERLEAEHLADQVVEGDALAVSALPGVRVLAVQAAQGAAGEERDEPGAGPVGGGHDVPRVHHRDEFTVRRAGLGRGDSQVGALDRGGVHSEPWKVRETTSRCCSGVRRTKLTAYPETRMVSCG
nr:hypothetical protein GCM10020092_074940 [Actinoplanes digitatis]